MAARRILEILIVILLSGSAASAQTYSLSENVKAGDCFRIHLETKVAGEMRVRQEDRLVALKHEMAATHEFPERILNVGSNGLPDKSARIYETAKAVVTVDQEKSERSLRADRALFVAQRNKDLAVLYCPAGPVTREELELTEHLDPLAVGGLLPGKEVGLGATWNVSNSAAQALCGFEGLTEQSLVCKLEEVKGQAARVSVAGSSTGIELGALVKLTVEANYQFDLQTQRLTRLEWKQKEERDPGPVSPAASVVATTTLDRTSIEQPASLSDVSLVSVPDGLEPAAPLLLLDYQDSKAGFHIRYEREWQTVSQNPEHTVWRLMERGDFVAQVTITPWTRAEKGKHLSAEEFAKAMAESPGWEPEQEVESGEVPSNDDRWIYRISAIGQLDGMKAMQNFYLVAGPGGEQVVLAFTMAPKDAKRLGTRDLSLAANVDFAEGRKEAEKPK
jgi:hypothetical protein